MKINLDKIIKVSGAVGKILPIFGREDFNIHRKYLLKENPDLAGHLRDNPGAERKLYDAFKEQYGKDRGYLWGAKGIDSADRIVGGLRLLAEAYPVVGQVIGESGNLAELPPKILYGAYYARKTKDYGSIPYYAATEAASFIPVMGEFVDMKNLYIDRARKTFRRRIAASFLEKLVKNAPKNPALN